MSEPRIVLDARCLRDAHGGVATYTAALVAELPRLLPGVMTLQRFTWGRTARETIGVYPGNPPWIPSPTPDL
jgi:hypothetical protein